MAKEGILKQDGFGLLEADGIQNTYAVAVPRAIAENTDSRPSLT